MITYVKGKITHPEHKTTILKGWHRVYMNTEHKSEAMKHVIYFD